MGALQTGAIVDSAAHDALGIDGIDEFVMYVAGAGRAAADAVSFDEDVEISPPDAQLATRTRMACDIAACAWCLG